MYYYQSKNNNDMQYVNGIKITRLNNEYCI